MHIESDPSCSACADALLFRLRRLVGKDNLVRTFADGTSMTNISLNWSLPRIKVFDALKRITSMRLSPRQCNNVTILSFASFSAVRSGTGVDGDSLRWVQFASLHLRSV